MQPRLLVERVRVYVTSISFPQYGQISSSNLITKYLNGRCIAIFRVQANVRDPVDRQRARWTPP